MRLLWCSLLIVHRRKFGGWLFWRFRFYPILTFVIKSNLVKATYSWSISMFSTEWSILAVWKAPMSSVPMFKWWRCSCYFMIRFWNTKEQVLLFQIPPYYAERSYPGTEFECSIYFYDSLYSPCSWVCVFLFLTYFRYLLFCFNFCAWRDRLSSLWIDLLLIMWALGILYDMLFFEFLLYTNGNSNKLCN